MGDYLKLITSRAFNQAPPNTVIATKALNIYIIFNNLYPNEVCIGTEFKSFKQIDHRITRTDYIAGKYSHETPHAECLARILDLP